MPNLIEQSMMAELIEMEGWADMMAAMPEETRQASGADCSRIDGALSISARNIPLVTFNRVMGVGLDHPATVAELEAIAGHIRQHSAPVAQVQIAPFAAPDQYEAVLAASGFTRTPANWAKMGRRSDAPPNIEHQLSIELADESRANDFAEVILAGFDMPPFFRPWLAALVGRDRWRCYIARQDGQVIAGGALYLGGEAAWLGLAATIASARKHGAQGALIARRIADAAEHGKEWVYTETGISTGPNPSLANMYRTGFECLHERGNWGLAS